MAAAVAAMVLARRSGGRAAATCWAALSTCPLNTSVPQLHTISAAAAPSWQQLAAGVAVGACSTWSGRWAGTQTDWAQHVLHPMPSSSSSSSSSGTVVSIHLLRSRQYSSSSGSSNSSGGGGGSSHATLPTREGVPQPTQRDGDKRPGAESAVQAAGWSRQEVFNVPNALSMLRLLSGPVIASWILDAQWALALPALAISGATDWADGWAARRFNQPSVLGSYLDPLADKVLICSVIGALGWSGVLPAPVVGIIVGRDVVLVTGAFAVRAKSFGWRWPGAAEFFRVDSIGTGSSDPGSSSSSGGGSEATGPADAAAAGAPGAAAATGSSGSSSDDGQRRAPAAPLVKPLLISKVNTVFQLGLVGTCILQSWLGWPGEGAVWAASALTAGTTVGSSLAYLQAYRQGRVLAPVPQQQPPGT